MTISNPYMKPTYGGPPQLNTAVPPDLMNMYDSVKKSISDEIKRQGEINYGNGEQVQDKIVQANRN